MKEVKAQLANETVTAEAGGGMVKVTVNGNREVVSIVVEKDLIKPEDADMMQDLIVAGVNKALFEAEQLAKKRLEDITRNIMPGGLGGLDMSRFGL